MSNRKHAATLHAIFAQPVHAAVRWKDIEHLLKFLGAEIDEGNGSRVRVALNNVRAVFHRPHPEPITDKGALNSVRRFLIEARVRPE